LDNKSESREILPVPFEARYVRIIPQTWKNRIAIQLEIFGCDDNGIFIPPTGIYSKLKGC